MPVVIEEKALPKIEQPTDNCPALPEAVCCSLFGDYRDLVKDTTEASDNFHYATFLQVLGNTINRKAHVYHARKTYPNFYTCCVGPTSLARKDTATSRGKGMLKDLNAEVSEIKNNESPQFAIINGIGSLEGLLDELSGEHKVRVVVIPEIASLIAKARQSGLSNLIPMLTEIYDTPDRLNPKIRARVVDCQEPFLSIMAGSTLDWLLKSLTSSDIYGGFCNRWMYFAGEGKDPMPCPPEMDKTARDNLMAAINTVRDFTSSLPDDGRVEISPGANLLFAKWYRDYYNKCKVAGILPTLLARLQDHVWKVSLLYALADMSDTIRERDLELAIMVGTYLEQSVVAVFSKFGATENADKEQRLLDLIRQYGQPMPHRELCRQLHWSSDDVLRVIQPMMKTGIVREVATYAVNKRRIVNYEVLA